MLVGRARLVVLGEQASRAHRILEILSRARELKALKFQCGYKSVRSNFKRVCHDRQDMVARPCSYLEDMGYIQEAAEIVLDSTVFAICAKRLKSNSYTSNTLLDTVTAATVQVKVKNWMSGTQGTTVAGMSATFGATLPTTVNEAQRTCAALTDPLDCCSNTTSKLADSIALATRGQCALTAKAETAQAADDQELYKMVCSVNDATVNEPSRPVVDPSVCFLFIMAQGPNSGTNYRQDKQIIEITAKRAGVFIVAASVFLLLRFYFMSSWITWLLIVTFCFRVIEAM